jgi:hypothetical protein
MARGRTVVNAVLPQRTVRVQFKAGNKVLFESEHKSKNTIALIVRHVRKLAREGENLLGDRN